MIINSNTNIINVSSTIVEALNILNNLSNLILFVVDKDKKLVGTLTDGDIRRGFMRELSIKGKVSEFMNTNFKYLESKNITLENIEELKKNNITKIPIVDDDFKIIKIIDCSITKSILPIQCVIMAGGKGERLKPLTDNCPKPMLKVGDKPILEHNVDRLIEFGIFSIFMSIKYLGNQIETYFGDGASKGIEIKYIKEDIPLGTFGSLSLIPKFDHDHILILNSDLLTNIDYHDFYKEFVNSNADMSIAAVPYNVQIPYAVLETNLNDVVSFKEKPTYTYHSNAGIYLIKREHLEKLKNNTYFNATDFMEMLIKNKCKVITYPLLGYWLDIGKHDDFKKAQDDIKHIKF